MTSKTEKPKERYANAKNKHIAAVIGKLYRFESEAIAAEKLKSLGEYFTPARNQEENPPKPCLIMWIKDFAVTKAQKEKGFMGNYAFMTVEKREDDTLYTLSATKLDTELKYHPRRKRIAAKMPNPGHPILRAAQKGKTFATIEEAQAELEKLHLEYPQTTVPAQNKLYLMVFSRKDNPHMPVQKFVLEIKNLQGGGFGLEYKKNEFKGRIAPAGAAQDKAEDMPMGHFTSMVALKRNKKK
jgi:hypothetical protein